MNHLVSTHIGQEGVVDVRTGKVPPSCGCGARPGLQSYLMPTGIFQAHCDAPQVECGLRVWPVQ